MLKKHLKFLRLSCYTALNSSDFNYDGEIKKTTVGGFTALVLLLMFFPSFVGVDMNIWSCMFSLMISYNMLFMNKGLNKVTKAIPVKDSFVVNNMLFVSPIIFLCIVFLASELSISVMIGIIFSSIFKDNPIESFLSYLRESIWGLNLMQITFAVCLMVGIWFLVSTQSFYKNKSRRIAGFVTIIIICIIGVSAEAAIMRSAGVKSEYGLSEIIYVLPEVPCVVSAVVFALISGIYAWKKCMFLYRHDVAGQAAMHKINDNFDRFAGSNKVLFSNKAKKRKVLAIIGVLLIIQIITGLSLKWLTTGIIGSEAQDSGSGEIHIETHNPSEYADWSNYKENEKVPEGVDFMYDRDWSTIFPNEVNTDYITEYYALVDGEYSFSIYEDDTSVSSWDGKVARFMVADYPADEYDKECDRISKLSYTTENADGYVTNHMLVDEKNFSGITYIAVYNTAFSNYEYAITNDDTDRIIYVYLNECRDIPTDVQYKAKKSSSVVPITMRNYAKGYSIHE